MAEKRVRRLVSLRRLAVNLLRVLAGQFLFGEILSIYVTLPFPSPMTLAAWAGVGVLVVHIFLGVLALAFSARMVVMAMREPRRQGLGLSLIAFVGLVTAFLAGANFTFGAQDENASFLMAFGFYLALLVGALILGRLPDGEPSRPANVSTSPAPDPGERAG